MFSEIHRLFSTKKSSCILADEIIGYYFLLDSYLVCHKTKSIVEMLSFYATWVFSNKFISIRHSIHLDMTCPIQYICTCILLNQNLCVLIKISLNCDPAVLKYTSGQVLDRHRPVASILTWSQHGWVIACQVTCGMKLRKHSQTSTV